MLSSIVQYLYIFLLIIFGVFVFIVNYFEKISIGESFLYFYTLLLIPVFDYIIWNNLSKKAFYAFIPRWINMLKYFSLLIVALILSYFDIDSVYLYMIVFLLWSILFNIDSRVSFIAALILFLYVPVLMMIGKANIAETFSIYAYYFLIIWVLLQWYDTLKNKYL